MKPDEEKPTIATNSDTSASAVSVLKVRRNINAVGIDGVGVDYQFACRVT
jgi:hypothetical protein